MASSGGTVRMLNDLPQVIATVVVGTQVRPAEELFTALRKGSTLQKYGRRGVPKFHLFKLSSDDKDLQWRSANNKLRSIGLLSVTRVIAGQQTSVFRRAPDPELEPYSFSLIYNEGPRQERSLDLVCLSQQEFETWYWGIQLVITVLKANLSNMPPPAESQTSSRRTSAADSDGSSAERSLHSKSTPMSMTGQMSRSLTTPLLGATREIGDCYMWGSLSPQVMHNTSDGDWLKGWTSSPLPKLVENTQALDVIRVACGSRHGALVTRGHELYTWGNGECGSLGHGSYRHGPCPQQVTSLFRKGVAAISCGDTHSAAVTHEGALYTWGSGACGQLGHGDTWTRCAPVRVATFTDIRVKHISCGPFHSAAITQGGQLYTWGDGMAGKLGHGDTCSSMQPRKVEALEGMQVLDVSCGWWHTAAVVAARTESKGDVRSSGNNNNGPVPGQLYTWGGEFSWQEVKGSSEKPSESLKVKRDNNQGCLGLGDRQGRMLPCLVSGNSLERHAVKQVVCGCNFTVAVTVDGMAYQMGSMETSNMAEKDCSWDGALVPTPVQGSAFGLFIEEIAAGRQHVAVVASKMQAGNGKPFEDARRMRLLTWGRGAEGQLGVGSSDDHGMPQIVTFLERRRILHVGCGGNHTLAVCVHDTSSSELSTSREQTLFGKGRAGSSRPPLTLSIPQPSITNQGPATTSRLEGKIKYNPGDISPSALGPLSTGSGSKRHSSRLGTITTKLLSNTSRIQRRDSMSSSSSASGLSSRGATATTADSNGVGATLPISSSGRISRNLPISQPSQRTLSMIGSSFAVELNMDGRPASFTSAARAFASSPSSPRMQSLRRSTNDDDEAGGPLASPALADGAVLSGSMPSGELHRMQERILKLERQLHTRNTEVEELRSIVVRRSNLRYSASGPNLTEAEYDQLAMSRDDLSNASSPLPSPNAMPTPVPGGDNKASLRTTNTNTTVTDVRTSAESSEAASSSGTSMPSPLPNGPTLVSSPGYLTRALSTARSADLPPRVPPEQGLKGGQRGAVPPSAFSNSGGAAAVLAAAGASLSAPPSSMLADGGRSVSMKTLAPELSEELRKLQEGRDRSSSREREAAALRDGAVSRDASISGVVNLRLQLSASSGNSGVEPSLAQTLALRIAGAAASVEDSCGEEVTLRVPHADGIATPVLYNNARALSRNVSQLSKASVDLTEMEDLRSENKQLREQMEVMQRRILALERLSLAASPSPGPGDDDSAATTSGPGQSLHWTVPAAAGGALANARRSHHRRAISMDTAATLQRFFSSQQEQQRQQQQQQQPLASSSNPSGSGRSFTEEVESGVFITLEPVDAGGFELKRIRFSKRSFTHEEAETWWSRNKTRVRERYNLVTPAPSSGGSGSPMLLSSASGPPGSRPNGRASVTSHRSTPSGEYNDLSRLLLSTHSHVSVSSSEMVEIPVRHSSQPRGTTDSVDAAAGSGSPRRPHYSSDGGGVASASPTTSAPRGSTLSSPRNTTDPRMLSAAAAAAAAATPSPAAPMAGMLSHPLSLMSPIASRTPSSSAVTGPRALSPVEDVSERDPASVTASESGSFHSMVSASPASPTSASPDRAASKKTLFTGSPLADVSRR